MWSHIELKSDSAFSLCHFSVLALCFLFPPEIVNIKFKLVVHTVSSVVSKSVGSGPLYIRVKALKGALGVHSHVFFFFSVHRGYRYQLFLFSVRWILLCIFINAVDVSY